MKQNSRNQNCVSEFLPNLTTSMSGINPGDEKLVFESSEAVKVVSTFDQLGLKEDLLRGIYAYGVWFFYKLFSCYGLIYNVSSQDSRNPLQSNSELLYL
jgi:hypothetical protein